MRAMQDSPGSFASVLKDLHRCIANLSEQVVRLSEEHEREIAGLNKGVEGLSVLQPVEGLSVVQPKASLAMSLITLDSETPCDSLQAELDPPKQLEEPVSGTKAMSAFANQAIEATTTSKATSSPVHETAGSLADEAIKAPSMLQGNVLVSESLSDQASRKSVVRFNRESAISASGSSESTVLSHNQDEEVPASRKSVIRFNRESAISALSSGGRSTVLSGHQDAEVAPSRPSRKSVIRFNRESAISASGSSGRSTVSSVHQDAEVLASRKVPTKFNRESAISATNSTSTVSFCLDSEEVSLYDDLAPANSRKEVAFKRASEWSTRTSLMTTGSDDDQEIIVQVLPVWTDEEDVNSVIQIKTKFHSSPSQDIALEDEEPICLDRLVSSPDSRQRLMWDILGIVIIVYDLIFIPLQVFDIKPSSITDFLSWFTTTYWTFDIPASFLVGFHTKGVVEMRTSKIAARYVKGWFAFDISVVSVDWLASTVKSNEQAGVKSSLLLRVLRMVRLLRLFKVLGYLDELLKRIQSELLLIILGIVNLLVFILLMNHIIACAWFWVGQRSDVLFGDSWITKNMVVEADVGYQYTTALHWSLTQFTPASMEVVPRNTLERTYNVITLLFAMVTFSSFVSSITNAMTRLRHLNSQWMEEQSVLQQYLKENQVSSYLTRQICSFLQKSKRSKGRKIHTQDVVMLDRLSKTLQDSLRSEVYSPILEVHPFFRCFIQVYPEGMQRIYRFAMEESTVACDQELFRVGELADRIHFVIKGAFRYTLSSVILDEGSYSVIVDVGGWLCEHALWIEWRHCGQLVASKHSEVVDVKALKFQTIVRRELIGVLEPCKYAMLFAEYVDELANSRKLTDIISDYDMIDEMAKEAWAAAMSKQDSIQMMRRKSKFKDTLMKHARHALKHLRGDSR